jgi:hypothetical protein
MNNHKVLGKWYLHIVHMANIALTNEEEEEEKEEEEENKMCRICDYEND